MNATPITRTNSARSRSPPETMSQIAVTAGLTVVGADDRIHHSAADQAPRQQDEQRRRQDSAPDGNHRFPAPALRQVEGAHVEQERQERKHEAEAAQRAHQVLEPAELVRLHKHELSGVLNGLAVQQRGHTGLERGEGGIELYDVGLARILQHGADVLVKSGQAGVEVGQKPRQVGQLALQLRGNLGLDRS